ncbi:MAG: hypothetical protein E4H20_09675 [Spirochaetales bacterium]|nr:MAG: hypothetical protein E4H20_09675 [Spirochaetales bacterium]
MKDLLVNGSAVLDLVLGLVDTMIGLGIFPGGDARFAGTGSGRRSGGSGLGPTIVVEESHEIRILPEAGPKVRAFVSAVARLESTGLVWTATLDKDAALAAFAWGFRADDIVERLAAYSGQPLPQSVRFSLDSWEAAGLSVRLRSGIVVALDGHHAAVLEHTPRAHGLIREKLAEGVYLLHAANLKDAEKALNGLGIRADVRGLREAGPAVAWTEAELASAPSIMSFIPQPMVISPGTAILESRRPGIIAAMLARLYTLDLTVDAKAAMADRIRAGYILSEDQLISADPPPDASVASGLDYPGKVRLLERALRECAGVEMDCLDGDNRYRITGWPREIQRNPEGLSVVIQGVNTEARSIPVRAVSKVRLIQTDLFGE